MTTIENHIHYHLDQLRRAGIAWSDPRAARRREIIKRLIRLRRLMRRGGYAAAHDEGGR